MMFAIAETARAVAEGRMSETQGLNALLRFGHSRFDVHVWFRASRQGVAPGYGELTIFNTVKNDPAPTEGRHVGGNNRRPPSPPKADKNAVPHPASVRPGTRFKSGTTQLGRSE